MNERERWIVYPLLFSTLGIALRDKIAPPTVRALSVDAGVVRCGEMEIIDAHGNPQVRIGVAGQSGRLEMDANDGRGTLILGSDHAQRLGVFAILPGRERPVPLTLYYRPEVPSEIPEITPRKKNGIADPAKEAKPQAEPEQPAKKESPTPSPSGRGPG